ncbi:SIR2 family NAD-dependent protein deacylase [Peptoanaerobacter stomatis]|uniref:SIR2 family NAD-dependent protein deacylase n=1 Tax=Peptoanaerobacter stomatis TaxID=796937 RepID=UPI003F9FDA36
MNYFNKHISKKTVSKEEQILRLKSELKSADAIVIGAGSGISTSAGFTYSGERFEKYFFDFSKKYGISDMYSGGFYPFEDVQTRWAWWARHIYFNRYVKAPKPVYDKLFLLIKDKDYFVITTNVDHQFQKAGFDKKRLFYTQGDYGLFQSVNHDIKKTYDNEDWVMKAMEAQGFVKDNAGVFTVPENKDIVMHIPIELIPKCPDNGLDMTLNLRADDSFVEDEGWHEAYERYNEFLNNHGKMHTLYLELGVGANTPVIVKYPFWQMTNSNEKAVYACINYGEAFCPREIEDRSICIDGDIGEILNKIV